MDESIIEELVRRGKITNEDIEEISASILTHDRANIVQRLHLFLCRESHDAEDGCSWYDEEGACIEDEQKVWDLPFHKDWKKGTIDLIKRMRIDWNVLNEFIDCVSRMQKTLSYLNARPDAKEASVIRAIPEKSVLTLMSLLSSELLNFSPELRTEGPTSSSHDV